MGRAAQKQQEQRLALHVIEASVVGEGSVFACFIPFLRALSTSEEPPLVSANARCPQVSFFRCSTFQLPCVSQAVRIAAVRTLGRFLECAPSMALEFSDLLGELACHCPPPPDSAGSTEVELATFASMLPVSALWAWVKVRNCCLPVASRAPIHADSPTINRNQHCAPSQQQVDSDDGQHVLQEVLNRSRWCDLARQRPSTRAVCHLVTAATAAQAVTWLLDNNKLRDERGAIRLLLDAALGHSALPTSEEWSSVPRLKSALAVIASLPERLADALMSDPRRLARVVLAICHHETKGENEESQSTIEALDLLVNICLAHSDLAAHLQELSPALVREAIKLRAGVVLHVVSRVVATVRDSHL